MSDTSVVLAEDLASSELLGSLPRPALEQLALVAKIRQFPALQPIFKEGDPGDSLHIVLRGIVKIVQANDAGREVALQTLTQGQVFGELAVLDPAPRSAGAIAIDETETIEVERADLIPLLDGHPQATRNMLGSLARSLTQAKEELKHHNQILDQRVRDRTKDLQETQLEVIRRLGQAAEFRDDDTGMHISRMSRYAGLLARAAGMTEGQCELLEQAAPMHDIGKIGIPDRILLKPGRLDPEEFELMKTHTTIGEALLSESKSSVMKLAQKVALAHHEKWDGTGYPHGRKAEQIPIEARICTISDVFDALTSARPYKKAWTPEQAFEEIHRSSGIHFDPQLARMFCDMETEILHIKDNWSKENV